MFGPLLVDGFEVSKGCQKPVGGVELCFDRPSLVGASVLGPVFPTDEADGLPSRCGQSPEREAQMRGGRGKLLHCAIESPDSGCPSLWFQMMAADHGVATSRLHACQAELEKLALETGSNLMYGARPLAGQSGHGTSFWLC